MQPCPHRQTRRELLAGGAAFLLAGPARRAALEILETAGAQAAMGKNVRRFVSRPDLKPVAEIAAARAEGERAIGRFKSKARPFCDSWETWRPDESWPPACLPTGWDEYYAL